MSEWEIIWQQRDTFVSGFGTTIALFGVSAVASLLIGVGLLYMMENSNTKIKSTLRFGVNIMRTLPFLILAYLLYYGLPQLGIRMEAMTVGFVSLSIYHGAYFCEIFRGQRKGMDNGLIESAEACGFNRHKIFTRIIGPSVVLKSIPLIANQLIICLKDTAFLSIITVIDITAAANSVQSMYFIPLKAFLVAIALYWVISIAIEKSSKYCIQHVEKRGLSNV
ncbi:ABC transporter permease subunit [Vibrio sp. CK2-1]|uniref:amino acid ABC transporter permease n=1 Tax=Vibrio sp. CK2-1 TaxID=2912249 RepID=UPI001EED4A3B|nr:ABC transporter permease subunit [Vibrio sp. CK2-1]MCF7352763.1 ABC transporter permease subunit [Vibrio sp. CK2-1]